MNKLSLKMKLGVGFGILLVIMVTMGVVSYRSVQKLGELSEQADQRANARFLATRIGSIINDQKAEYREFLLSDTEAEMSRYAENNSALTETFSKLEPLMTSDEDRRQLAELR